MSDKVIPERCTHNTIVRTTDNMNCDPWWWECDDCGKQFVDREQLRAAEAALSEAQQRIASGYYDKECRETLAEATKERFDLQAQVAQLQATICTLRAALEEYGEHQFECGLREYPDSDWACRCGFNAALAALNEAKK